MYEGKKSVAESIVYGAFDIIEARAKANPIEVFRAALDNVAPAIDEPGASLGVVTWAVDEAAADRLWGLSEEWSGQTFPS